MELSGLECRGCGSTNVTYIPNGRILVCNQCGKKETYSRATLNANEKITSCRNNAISFFKSGEYENAKRYALDVLNIFIDNAPSLFIIEYYNEFVIRKPNSMKSFFKRLKDVALEYDEMQDMQELIVGTANNLCDFEEEIIQFMALNLQSEEDAADLCEFLDRVCPYFIMKRPSINFMTKELTEYYYELAGHCNIPKTCFALLKAIETNPDSPYYTDSFYLRARTQYFFDNFVIPVGNIIHAIQDPEIRRKFEEVYNNKKCSYEKLAKEKGD